MPDKKVKFAVVCSSNMNRSMEAHRCMKKRKFDVQSFGSGTQVKLPGSSANRPNVYPFDWKYADIYDDLKKKDKYLYTQNGVLMMLDRNKRIKERPEKIQTCPEKFDVIISLDERVYDQIVEDFLQRKSCTYKQVHIININVEDNHEDATIGAFVVCELAKKIEESGDLDDDMDELIQDFEEKNPHRNKIFHTVFFY